MGPWGPHPSKGKDEDERKRRKIGGKERERIRE